MANPKKRKKHQAYVPHHIQKTKQNKHKAVWVFAIAFAVAGLGIAALSTALVNYWWFVAPVIGLVIGILSGKQIEKEIFNKS